MNGIPDCDNDTPTSADKGYYEEIYSPAAVTNLTGSSSVAGRANLNWNTTNVHVEKDFEIQRCTGRKTVCDAASASWTENVATAVTNAHVIRLTEQGSGWRTYRVVSRTSALTGDQAEAESTTVEVNVAAPSGGGGTTTSPSPTTTCTLAGSAGSGGSVGSANGACGTLAVTAEANAGYYVSSWTGCTNSPATGAGITTSTCSRAVVASDPNKTVSVTFALNQCTVNARAGTGGNVSPMTRTVNCGGSVTLTATPNQGYHISGWTGGGCSGTGAKCTVTVGSSKGNATTVPVSVTFALNQCTVNATAGTGGGVSPTTRTVNCGTRVTLTATPNQGYHVSGWTGGGCSGTGAKCTVTVGSSKGNATTVPVSVRFARRATCHLNGSPGTGGSTSSASGPCGTTLTIRATASWPRYQFTGWSGSCSGTGACSVRVGTSRDTTSSTVSVAAGFGKRYCTVTVRAAKGGSASGGGRVWCGAVSVPYTSSASGGWCVSHFHSTFGVAGQAIPFVICPQTGRGSVTPEVDLTITAYFVLRSSLSGGPSGQAETPSATPSPSATATPSPSATAPPTPSATATPSPTATPAP